MKTINGLFEDYKSSIKQKKAIIERMGAKVNKALKPYLKRVILFDPLRFELYAHRSGNEIAKDIVKHKQLKDSNIVVASVKDISKYIVFNSAVELEVILENPKQFIQDHPNIF